MVPIVLAWLVLAAAWQRGMIAVDATLTESSSKALRAKLDSLHKPLLAILLTHGHPDHYNGVTNLVAGRPVPILATAGVDSVIRANDAAKDGQWRPVFKDEWPARRTFPTRIVPDGESVTFDGVTVTAHELGPGESHADAYWLLAGLELLDWERRYLTTYRRAVAELSGGRAALSDSAKLQLVARMETFLPSKQLAFLIGLGADPVAAELATEGRPEQ